MDTDKLAALLFLMVLTESTANNSTPDATTLPITAQPQLLNTTDTDTVPTVAQSDNVSETATASITHEVTDNPALRTSSSAPSASTKSASNSTVSTLNSTSSSSESANSSETQNQTSIISTPPMNETAENPKHTTEKSEDITEDISTAHGADITSSGGGSMTPTMEPSFYPAYDWISVFLRTHHCEGQYYYDEGKYLFDFVARNVHPLSSKTLVAFFYDEDGAILEMNGTSQDGQTIQFVLDKVYTAGYRFPPDMEFQLVGTLVASVEVTSYDGNITKPINSSFQTFHMNKDDILKQAERKQNAPSGLGVVETGDAAGTRTAIIVVIPISIAFLGIIGTVTVLCWASKKGLLRGRHRSYQLFPDTPVTFESEAETIHI